MWRKEEAENIYIRKTLNYIIIMLPLDGPDRYNFYSTA